MQHRLLPVVVLMMTSAIWGLNWIPLKHFQSQGVEGLSIIFFTHALLALVVAPFAIRDRGSVHDLKFLFGIACAGGLGICCFNFALVYGDVVRVMVLFYLLPVWGVLGGRIFLNEDIDLFRWLGVIIAIPGTFLILGGVSIFETPPSWIDLLALLSGMAFAANNILFRGVEGVSLNVKLVFMFIGGAFLTGVFLMFGMGDTALVDARVWGTLTAYTLTWLLLANIGSLWAIERIDAGRSSIIIILQLVAAVVSAMLLGGERLSAIEWTGCALVICAGFIEAVRDFKSTRHLST